MNKAPLSLTLLAAALAFAGTTSALAAPTAKALEPGVAKPSIAKKVVKTRTANQKIFAKRVSAMKLWPIIAKSMARVSGTITVDDTVLPYLSGQCSDVVIKAFAGTSFGDEVASMRASGDIHSGSCTYTMFVKPQSELRVLSYYEGGRSPHHPGDYLEVNGVGAHTFAAAAGGSYTRDFVLTYDFIK